MQLQPKAKHIAGAASLKSRITLQHIADHLGISKFAVSRALTGKPGVSDDTRQHVLAAAEHFGYVARRVKPSSKTIEVIFRDRNVANRELWIDVQHGLEMEATRHGYSMAVRWTDDPGVVTKVAAEAGGFVLVGPQSDRIFEAVRNCAVPAVIVAHVIPELYPIDQITATDVEAGVHVAKFLNRLGHRKMVYVHGQLGYPGRQARLRGFQEAISAIPSAELREIAFQEDYMAARFREEFQAMCGAGYEPTAMFCGSDGVAVTVVSELLRMGLRVPEDVSVVGHADYPIATQVSPNLTTINMPHKQMGVAAVRRLLARSGQLGILDDLPPQRISLVPYLVERESTGPVTSRSWRPRLEAAMERGS